MIEVARLGDDIPPDEGDLALSAHQVVLWKTKWQGYSEAAVLTWSLYRLDNGQSSSIPTTSGVYSLLVQPGIAAHPAASFLMYVGKARNLRNRFRNYLTSERRPTARSKIYRRLTRYSDYLWFCCATIPDADDEALGRVEDRLLVAYVPAWNDQLPAEIRDIVKGVLK